MKILWGIKIVLWNVNYVNFEMIILIFFVENMRMFRLEKFEIEKLKQILSENWMEIWSDYQFIALLAAIYLFEWQNREKNIILVNLFYD